MATWARAAPLLSHSWLAWLAEIKVSSFQESLTLAPSTPAICATRDEVETNTWRDFNGNGRLGGRQLPAYRARPLGVLPTRLSAGALLVHRARSHCNAADSL